MAIVEVKGEVDITIDVGARLRVNQSRLPDSVIAAIKRVLNELRHIWRERMLSIWPVLTGRSQSRWENRIIGLEWVLKNPVPYAAFVHPAGDDRLVWKRLERFSEELIRGVLPKLKELIRAWRKKKKKVDKNRRGVLSLTARTAALRETSKRFFRAETRVFKRESPTARHRRQLERFARS